MYLLAGFSTVVIAADAPFVAEKPFEAEDGKLSGTMKKTKDTGSERRILYLGHRGGACRRACEDAAGGELRVYGAG